MVKRSKTTSASYRSRESYLAKDPEKRKAQIANLQHRHKTKGIVSTVPVRGRAPNKYPDDICGFIEDHFYIPETRKPMVLLPWQREALTTVFDGDYNQVVLGQPKKTGKSALCAAIALWYLLNKPFAEIYMLASSAGQSQLTCFDKLIKAIRMNPILRDCCKIRLERVEYGESFAMILAPNQAVAGINPSLVIAEELWSWNTQEHRRAWDELCNVPTRSDNMRIISSYAGYAEDQNSILWELYQEGIAQRDGTSERDPRFYFKWFGLELYDLTPWVKPEYLVQQKNRQRESAWLRMHCNQWASGEEAFVDAVVVDACTNHALVKGADFDGPVCVGIDIGLKHDCSAVVVVGTLDYERLVVVDHRCFVPVAGQTLDLERTVEAVMLALAQKYTIMGVNYDPFQAARSAKTLSDKGLPMHEYCQTVGNTVAMSECLSGLLSNQNLMLYDDPELKEHILNAKAKETQRGWRLVKARQSQKIDLAISLAMACKSAQTELLLRKEQLIYV